LKSGSFLLENNLMFFDFRKTNLYFQISLPHHVFSSHLSPFVKDAASDAYIDMVLEKARELILSEVKTSNS
jgi:hypothetical protein